MLKAASLEFAERGLEAASIEDVAARAGLTRGAVYYYFSDKIDLATDLQSLIWARLGREASVHLDPAAGTLTNLKAAFRAFVVALESEAEARFLLRDCWATAAARQEQEHGVHLVEALLVAGVAAGELDADLDAEVAARALLGAFAEATLHIMTTGRLEPTLTVVERMVDGLAAGGARRRRRRRS